MMLLVHGISGDLAPPGFHIFENQSKNQNLQVKNNLSVHVTTFMMNSICLIKDLD